MGPTGRTKRMPKAVCGDDVTAWGLLDPERTPEAEAPLPVAADPRLRLARPGPRPCSEVRPARGTESAASAETGSATCARGGAAARQAGALGGGCGRLEGTLGGIPSAFGPRDGHPTRARRPDLPRGAGRRAPD